MNTPYIRLVKVQLVRQIPDVYVSVCVLAGELILLFFLVLLAHLSRRLTGELIV